MFKFRPTMTTLEQRENPSGPELIDPLLSGPPPAGPVPPVVAPTPPPPVVPPLPGSGLDPITGIIW